MRIGGGFDYRCFEEADDTTFIGVIPVAALMEADQTQLDVASISVFSDRMSLTHAIRIREGHPELEWQKRGRAGHPYTTLEIEDDIGTSYVLMPGGGGGGMKEWRQEMKVVPGIPKNASTLVIKIAETVWELPKDAELNNNDFAPNWRWQITVSASDLILAKPLKALIAE